MHIYKKACPLLIIIAAVILLVNIVFIIWQVNLAFFSAILAFISVFLYVFILAFFRIPNRSFVTDETVIYSPADGKIVANEEVFEDEYLKTACKKVSIFMSVFNVHQNRIPVSGKVVYSKHHPGKYLVAWNPKSSLKNERVTVVIETLKGELILIRQIAGIVARRIICNVQEGDRVKQGDELGFIMFGSRVDVFLPQEAQIKVILDDKVKANKHMIAEMG
ncbi:MAG: phosphatidylserine decarboxylase family protein [Bacteroidales bacterium]|nr:phosphatidylserine decarboxylase family protein [Bacteroidales bacterium]